MLLNFVVLKMKTGETIFAEVMDADSDRYTVRYPMILRPFEVDGQEHITLARWMPFNDDEIFDFPAEIVYYIGNISETYVRFYGSAVIREKVAKIQAIGKQRIEDGELSSDVLRSVIKQISDLGDEASIKYGLSPQQDVEDDIGEEDLSPKRILN